MSTNQSDFYSVGGSLPVDAPSYVKREADEALFTTLMAGNFCYVLTSRQMGKSSLMKRTAQRLRREGTDVAELDLSAIGKELTIDQWYYGLLKRLSMAVGVSDAELRTFWEAGSRLGPAQRWQEALERLIMPRVAWHLVIFVDEIDLVQSLNFSADDFFAGIRACYNRRADDPLWHKVNFCLLGVASPSDLIRDPLITPFNIGHRIALHDFTPEEASPLAERLGTDEATNRRLQQRILHWTNGQPYLTQRLCREAAARGARTPRDIDCLCNDLFFVSRKEKDPNLEFVGLRLAPGRDEIPHVKQEQYEEELAGRLDLFRRVRNGERVPDEETRPHVNALRLSGVIRRENSCLRVRNRIYERAFGPKWLEEKMPGAELRRQRTARRRGFLRATALASLVIVVLAGLTLFAFAQQREAQKMANAALVQTHLAQQERQRADNAAEQLRDKNEALRQALLDARKNEEEATKQRNDAQRQRQEARNQTLIALNQAALARQAQQRATDNAEEAQRQEGIAQDRTKEANRQKEIAEDRARQLEKESGKNRRLTYEATIIKLGRLKNSMDESGLLDEALLNDMQDLLTLARAQQKGPENKVRGFEFNYYHRYVTIKRVLTLRGHDDEVMSVAWSPDGKRLASASLNIYTKKKDERVKIWDSETGAELLTLRGHTERVWSVAWSPDGTRVASASSDKTVKVWDARSGAILLDLSNDDEVHGVAWSPDGKYLASGGGGIEASNVIGVWEISTGRLVKTLKGHRDDVYTVAWSPDGMRLASGSWDKTVKLWDVGAGTESGTLAGHTDRIYGVAWSPDGKEVASGSLDGIIKIWDVATGTTRLVLKDDDRGGNVYSLAWSRDGRRIASSKGDGTVDLWDAAKGVRVLINRGHGGDVRSVAFSPDGRRLASASHDHTVKVWDVNPEAESQVYHFSANDVSTVAPAADGTSLILIARKSATKWWDISSKPETLTIKVPATNVRSYALSPDRKRLATISQQASGIYESMPPPKDYATLNIWDIETGANLLSSKDKSSTYITLAWSPDGKRLAVRGWRSPRVCEITATGAYLRTFALPEDSLGERGYTVWSPDSKKLALSYFAAVKVLDVETGRTFTSLSGHSGQVNEIAWSPDGERLATASEDSRIKLWDVKTGAEFETLRGHTSAVYSVAWSPDGKRLASAGADQTVKVWDAETAGELLNFKGQSYAVAWLDNGQRLGAMRAGRTMIIWDGHAVRSEPVGAR